MRARAGDPPRTMAQKILAARSRDPSLASAASDLLEVDVDQIVLVRAPGAALAHAVAAGLKKTSAEVAVAYDGHCVTGAPAASATRVPSGDVLGHGVLLARPGVGFPGPVHLERFASPARLCVTDDPRLAGVGGIGMLTLVVPTASLGHALAHGSVVLRRPVSVQVLMAGRLRPFVCARDVALELLRRGLGDVVRRVEEATGAPVVVEFAGPSARALSVAERAVIAAVAPQLGAAAAVFVADERTEVFLRDQRRSKAHRALAADAGAPSEEVVNIDLGAVDPLVLDGEGRVRAVRDLAGQPVSQALLGGDGGVTLRDLFATATLLKSKRVPPRLDFLLAAPSRQMLEVLADAGALTDLIATGARLVEPDARVVRGEMYPPASSGVALQTFEREPRMAGQRAALVTSAETLAYAVATGELGDPRAFKRPVRVTVPRALPTDDVLVARKAERGAPARVTSASEVAEAFTAWRAAQTLELVEGSAFEQHLVGNGRSALAVVCGTLDEVRDLASRAQALAPSVRAVLSPYIPSALVTLFSAAGIAALRIDASTAKKMQGQKSIALPAPAQWAERGPTTIAVGGAKLPFTWLAVGAERAWATGRSSGILPSRVEG
jgi:aconitate hydratase